MNRLIINAFVKAIIPLCALACFSCVNTDLDLTDTAKWRIACNEDDNCPEGLYCGEDEVCVTKERIEFETKSKNGSECIKSSECRSGFCVDGYCCEGECTGECKFCNSSGQCQFVAAGDNPDFECGATGCKGVCDGEGGCDYSYVNSKKCSLCKECQDGECVYVKAGEDTNFDCEGGLDACNGACNGEGACSYAATDGTECLTFAECRQGACQCLYRQCATTCCDDGTVCYHNNCCVPKKCEELTAIECGDTDDTCGTDIFCGDCNDSEVCYHNKCCERKCDNRVCGDDGCGGTCGECIAGTACDGAKCVAVGVDDAAPWPVFRADEKRTGLSKYAGPSQPSEKLRVSLGGTGASSPVVASDGSIIVGGAKKLLGVDPGTQSIKWNFETAGAIEGTAAIAKDGSIFFGSLDNKIYALDNSGKKIWEYDTSGKVSSSPLVTADGHIIAGSFSNALVVLNRDGSLAYKAETGGWVLSSPALVKYEEDTGLTKVVFGSDDTELYVLSWNKSGNFQKAATNFVTGAIEATPCISLAGDLVFVGTFDNRLISINVGALALGQTYTTEGNVYSSAALSKAGDVIYFGSHDKKLYAVKTDTFERKWYFPTDSQIWSSPAVDSNGAIYFASGKTLYAVTSTGNEKWHFDLGAETISSPAISADGTIYIVNGNGELIGIGE